MALIFARQKFLPRAHICIGTKILLNLTLSRARALFSTTHYLIEWAWALFGTISNWSIVRRLVKHLAKTLHIRGRLGLYQGYTSFVVVDNVSFVHPGRSSTIIVNVHNTSVSYGGAWPEAMLRLATSKTIHRQETKLIQAKAHRYQRCSAILAHSQKPCTAYDAIIGPRPRKG